MLEDASFRILLVNRLWKTFLDAWGKADFTPAQKKAFAAFVNYVNELGRIVTKEEGEMTGLL